MNSDNILMFIGIGLSFYIMVILPIKFIYKTIKKSAKRPTTLTLIKNEDYKDEISNR